MTQSPLWMVRTSKNILEGPFSQSELVRQIRDHQWIPQDEVCPSGGYWFSLQDIELLHPHLGIAYPVAANLEDPTDRIDLTQSVRADLLRASALADMSPASATEIPRAEEDRPPLWKRLDILIPLLAAFLLLFMLRAAFR